MSQRNEFKIASSKTKLDFTTLNSLHYSKHSDKAKGGTQYLFCNEQEQDKSLAKMAEIFKQMKRSDESISLHIGFSVAFNLDLLSLPGSPDVGIILDIDPNVNAIYQHIEANFKNTDIDTPKKFVTALVKSLTSDSRDLLCYPSDYIETLFEDALTKGYGFLSSTENFLIVKNKCCQGNIFFGCANIEDVKAMELISTWFKQNKVSVETLYLSNIPEWYFDSKKSLIPLQKNMANFIGSKTYIIDAFYPTSAKKGSGPPQRITIGQMPSYQRNAVIKRRSMFDNHTNEENKDTRVSVSKTGKHNR